MAEAQKETKRSNFIIDYLLTQYNNSINAYNEYYNGITLFLAGLKSLIMNKDDDLMNHPDTQDKYESDLLKYEDSRYNINNENYQEDSLEGHIFLNSLINNHTIIQDDKFITPNLPTDNINYLNLNFNYNNSKRQLTPKYIHST